MTKGKRKLYKCMLCGKEAEGLGPTAKRYQNPLPKGWSVTGDTEYLCDLCSRYSLEDQKRLGLKG